MCSIVCCVFDRTVLYLEVCDRSQITALKSHGASKLAMEARATRTLRADEECDRSQVLRSIAVHSIAPSALECTSKDFKLKD